MNDIYSMKSELKEVQTKLMKGVLDLIVLQFLNEEKMHGYKMITKIRRNFDIYFGPSTMYPLLSTLEKKGYVESEWDMHTERPRKVYTLTNNGKKLLNFAEDSLNFICRKIGITGIDHSKMDDLINEKKRLKWSRRVDHSKIDDLKLKIKKLKWSRRAALNAEFGYLPNETQEIQIA